MTPHEWLIKEYQRKETLLRKCHVDTSLDTPEALAELYALVESVQRQPFIVLKNDHECTCDEDPIEECVLVNEQAS